MKCKNCGRELGEVGMLGGTRGDEMILAHLDTRLVVCGSRGEMRRRIIDEGEPYFTLPRAEVE